MQFSELNLNEKILINLEKLGFFAPNAVQQKFIPLAKSGADILCKSETGSGKTLAYVLPILDAICTLNGKIFENEKTFENGSDYKNNFENKNILENENRLENENNFESEKQVGLNFSQKDDKIEEKICFFDENLAKNAQNTKKTSKKMGKSEKTKSNVLALVCAPTKELVMQIKQVFDSFCKNLGIKTCAVIGGSDFTRQRMALKSANIVVGTTGRLLDHLDRRTLKLNNLKFLVLDEADVMLDMGFVDDILKIEKACPKIRQNFLLSATFNEKVKSLATKFLKNPSVIEMSKENKVVSKISQCYVLCKKNGKFETIVKFLQNLYKEKVIIFVNTKKMAEELNAKLKQKEIYSEFINGDLILRERKRVMDKFKNGENDILIATDVASRGLDIDGVSFVINYDMPREKDTYIHRVGRTARAGRDGVSLSLINSETQLNFLLENFDKNELVELKVKRDERLNKYIFVKSDKKQDFDFSDKQKFKTKKENKKSINIEKDRKRSEYKKTTENRKATENRKRDENRNKLKTKSKGKFQQQNKTKFENKMGKRDNAKKDFRRKKQKNNKF